MPSFKEGTKRSNYRESVIYVFDHKTIYLKKIDIDFDNVVDGKIKDLELDVLNRKRINPDAVSPDGYVFERNSRRGNGLFSSMFSGRRRYHALKNGARTVPLEEVQPIYSDHFIG